MDKSLQQAEQHIEVKENEIDIIKHCRKNLLFHKEKTWVKIENSEFDVTMGSLDSAEIAEKCGITLLNEIKNKVGPLKIVLYRDVGLLVSEKSGQS